MLVKLTPDRSRRIFKQTPLTCKHCCAERLFSLTGDGSQSDKSLIELRTTNPNEIADAMNSVKLASNGVSMTT
jgi:hypothetical protein